VAPKETGTGLNHAAVEVRGLVKDYGPRRVLDIDALVIRRRSVCAVTGENGSGKTTLLSLLALLEPPTSGEIMLFGRSVTLRRMFRDGNVCVPLDLRRRVVMVHEQPWMFHASALANVAYGLSVRGIARSEARKSASAALDLVGMTHAARWWAPRLSAGEMRRVALARALVLQPELLLLDEPLADVDAQHAAVLERVIRDLPQSGATVVLATHRLDTALRLAEQCVSLVCGRVQLTIDPRAVVVVRSPRGPAPFPETGRPTRGAHYTGRVVALATEGECVRVTVDVGVPIVALVARQMFHEMDLRLGERVSVVLDASSPQAVQLSMSHSLQSTEESREGRGERTSP
jgi:tungstate transport system ATP-binding protein